MRKGFSKGLVLLATIGAMLVAVPAVMAWGGGGDGGGDDRNRPDRAVSYINPDTGAATANPDVAPNSSCFSPDQSDRQRVSPAGTATNNVHNDACFFGGRSWSWGGGDSQEKVDGPATFESSGVGFISACPDPDGAGPKVAVLSDTNGDGRNDRCFQSGYQEKNVAGDKEFHARLNSTTPGNQTVVWCYDPDRDGCADEYRLRSTIEINWVS